MAIARKQCGIHLSVAMNEHKIRGTAGSSVFYAVCVKAKLRGPTGKVSQSESAVSGLES
jgi:hypothetical protein